MALQALSEYAILSYVGGVNLTISLASTNLDFQETFELQWDNKKILQKAVVRNPIDISTFYCLRGIFSEGLNLIRPSSQHLLGTSLHFVISSVSLNACNLDIGQGPDG